MNRIHTRNGVLYLKRKDGSEERIVVRDFTLDSSAYPCLPKITVQESPVDYAEGMTEG